MRELAAVSMSDDGKFLIARDKTSGDEFHIRADDRLKSAINVGRVRTGQLEKHMESSLNPRDIQTRIRRGDSPEVVADAAGVDIERIMAYAIPILAERENICDRGRRSVVRRKHVTGTPRLLGELVAERLLADGDVPENAAWDSFRREDGRWTIMVTPSRSHQTATFIFDVQGRYVTADDADAVRLVADEKPLDAADMAIADAIRVDSAPDTAQIDADGAKDGHPVGVSSLKVARDRRAMEQLALSDDLEYGNPPQAHPEDQSPPPRQSIAVGDERPDGSAHDDEQPSRKRRERRRVPSWDEIMFGGKAES